MRLYDMAVTSARSLLAAGYGLLVYAAFLVTSYSHSLPSSTALLEETLWEVPGPGRRAVLAGVSMAGWLLVLTSTFLIDHWDLFGLRQSLAAARRQQPAAYRFVTPLWYRLVRHPIYLGFLVAFWVAPTMSVGHLIFAIAATGYVLVGVRLEERDLVSAFGEDYRAYRRRVPMLIPIRKAGAQAGTPSSTRP